MSNNISKKIAYFLIIFSFVLFGISGYLSLEKSLSTNGITISKDDLSVTKRPSVYFDDEPKSNSDNNTNSNRENKTTNKINRRGTAPIKTSDPNEILRQELQNKYNITIKFGEEVIGYSVGGMNVNPITSYNDNSIALSNLETALEKYPDDFFNELNSVYPLTIYLIDTFSVANVTGVTDSTNTKTVNMSIATAYPFDDSFNHETYHYIEHYLNYKNGYFTTWEKLNPDNFVYNDVQIDLSYSRTLEEDAYFVNDYAQVSPTEDRASTFEYMMATNKPSCLNKGNHVYLKAKYMSDIIDSFMDSVSEVNIEYWERFL